METAQFKTEKSPLGADRVALFQPMPKPAKELMHDEELLKKMLAANVSEGKEMAGKIDQISSIKIGEKIEGVQNTLHKATIHFNDSEAVQDVVFKFNRGGTPDALASQSWREAYFYGMMSHMAPTKTDCYLALIDKETGQYFLILRGFKTAMRVTDVLLGDIMKQDMTEKGGPNCTFGYVLNTLAKQLANFHSMSYVKADDNQKKIQSLDADVIPSAKWIFGEGRESFKEVYESAKIVCEAALAKGEGLNPLESKIPAFMKSSMDKVTFDSQFDLTKEDQDCGIPHALTMGQHLDFSDLLWIPEDSSIALIDFEHVSYGPIIKDLAMLLASILPNQYEEFGKACIKVYWEELEKLGKIDTKVYTFEKLTLDFRKMMLPSMVAFLAKKNLKGEKGLLTFVTKNIEQSLTSWEINEDNVLPTLIATTQIIEKPKAAEFDLQFETGPDGKQRVKLFQPIPFSVEEAGCDVDLIKKLLSGNGMDVKEVEFTNKLSAGMSQVVKSITCHMNDGSECEILIKMNNGAGFVKDQWRESLFFADILQAPGKEAFREQFQTPKIHLIMIDKDTGRQILFMEFLGGDNYLPFEQLIATQVGTYKFFGSTIERDIKPMTEAAGADITVDDACLQIITQFAILHAFHWDDKSLFEKYDYIRMIDFMKGENEEDYNKRQEQIQTAQKGIYVDGLFTQNYPEMAEILKGMLEKSKSFQNFKDTYLNDPNTHFSLCHGDSHERQCIWDKARQRAIVFDYELMRFGPPIMDLCYFWMFNKFNNDLDIDKMCTHYHKVLTTCGGNVTAESYSLEQCIADFGRMYLPIQGLVLPQVWDFDPVLAPKICDASMEVVKKYGITKDNVLPNFSFFDK